MAIRKAEAVWQGSLKEGSGSMKLGSGAFEGPFSFGTRFEEVPGTNPEELIGAAHAGCFSMFMSALLTNAGFPPNRIHTTAKVHLGRDDAGPVITKIELHTEAEVPGIGEEAFQEIALKSKKGCPISRALAAVSEVVLDAKLV